ncbi:hypothetical protein KAI78_04740 [bacterium]|nr:hypothetical protein [bacterium]
MTKYSRNTVFIFVGTLIILAGTIFSPQTFETNDDMLIIRMVSGRLGPVASAKALFPNILFSSSLGVLYKAAPGIPWYGLILNILTIFSLFVIISSLTKLKNTKAVLAGLLTTGIFFYRIFFLLTFTKTALFMQSAFFLYLMIDIKHSTSLKWTGIIPYLLLPLSFLIRSEFLPFFLLFFLPVIIWILVKGGKKKTVLLISSIALSFFLIAGNGIYYKRTLSLEFQKFQKARGYLNGTYIHEENENTEGALKKANWSKAEYELAKHFFFQGEKTFNAVAFESFNRENKTGIFKYAQIKVLKEYIETTPISIHFTVALYVLLSIFLFLFRMDRRFDPLVISVVWVLLGIFVFSFIRLPERIWAPLIFYFVFHGVLCMDAVPVRKALGVTVIMLLSVFFLLNYFDIGRSNIVKADHFRRHLIEMRKMTKKLNGPIAPILPIHPAWQNYECASPMKEFKDYPEYETIPGGWNTYSPYYYRSLKCYSIDSSEELMEQAVQGKILIAATNDAIGKTLLDHFNNYLLDNYRDYSGAYDVVYSGELFSILKLNPISERLNTEKESK